MIKLNDNKTKSNLLKLINREISFIDASLAYQRSLNKEVLLCMNLITQNSEVIETAMEFSKNYEALNNVMALLKKSTFNIDSLEALLSQLYEIKNEVSLKDLLLIYRKCLTILSELHKERIAYIDIHAKNFLINENLDVKLIDFEQDLVKFDDEHALKNSLQNYYKMINLLNERINIPVHYSKPETLDEAHRNLDALVKKLK